MDIATSLLQGDACSLINLVVSVTTCCQPQNPVPDHLHSRMPLGPWLQVRAPPYGQCSPQTLPEGWPNLVAMAELFLCADDECNR